MTLMTRGMPPLTPMHFAQRRGREDVAGRAGDAQAMAHVGERVFARQRFQVEARRDALRELAQVVAGEQVAQFRLADQDDLQELLRLGLEVGEQPHLLEHLGVRFCASSTISTTRRPSAWARSR